MKRNTSVAHFDHGISFDESRSFFHLEERATSDDTSPFICESGRRMLLSTIRTQILTNATTRLLLSGAGNLHVFA
jgi:hypothetical protein